MIQFSQIRIVVLTKIKVALVVMATRVVHNALLGQSDACVIGGDTY